MEMDRFQESLIILMGLEEKYKVRSRLNQEVRAHKKPSLASRPILSYRCKYSYMRKYPAMGALDFTFKIKADFLGVLAHPARLRLLEALKLQGKTVGSLAAEAQLSQPAASKHLSLLRQAGILASEQSGKTVVYRVATPAIFPVLRGINAVLLEQMRRAERDLRTLALKR